MTAPPGSVVPNAPTLAVGQVEPCRAPAGLTTRVRRARSRGSCRGSAAAVKLFQDVLGFSRKAREDLKEARDLEAQANRAELEARIRAASQ